MIKSLYSYLNMNKSHNNSAFFLDPKKLEVASDKKMSANYKHLRHLFILRNFFILIQFFAIVISILYLHISLPLVPIFIEAFGLVLFNLWVGKRLKLSPEVTDNEIFRHLLFDIAALSIVLFFTGGASNPFITLFIVPLIISVTVLSPRYSWIFSIVTLSVYSILMFQYVPLEMMMHDSHNMSSEFDLHIVGMWTAFAFSAALISHFVVKMGNTIREQDAMLTKANEAAMRDKQIVELGSLAAGTAHELGTPLGTMSLLISEIRHELTNAPEQVIDDIDNLKQQIERCKNALSHLSVSAGALNVSSGSTMTVKHFLERIHTEWYEHRPDITLSCYWHGEDEVGFVLGDRTLTQAVINLLDNAADASPADVEWKANWNKHKLQIDILDKGKGLQSHLINRIGKSSVSQAEEGLGLGLFLSRSVIEHFGGELKIENRESGGVITLVTLPLLKNDLKDG